MACVTMDCVNGVKKLDIIDIKTYFNSPHNAWTKIYYDVSKFKKMKLNSITSLGYVTGLTTAQYLQCVPYGDDRENGTSLAENLADNIFDISNYDVISIWVVTIGYDDINLSNIEFE